MRTTSASVCKPVTDKLISMKRTVPLLFLLGLLTLSGCTRHYVPTLNGGAQIDAVNKPKLKNGMYVFKDASGRENSISSGRVREISAASLSAGKSKGFKPPQAVGSQ